MRNTLSLLIILFFTISLSCLDKPNKNIEVVDFDGFYSKIDLSSDYTYVINFWATWCSPCKKELNTIHDLYPDWQDETGVTLVAVSVDDEKTKRQVAVYSNGKAWDYEILLDPNGDFKRAMGVNNVPHTFLIDTDGNIVYSHNNYAPGDEEDLYEEILKLGSK